MNWIGCIVLNAATATHTFLASNNPLPLPNQIHIKLVHPKDQTTTPQYDFIRSSSVPYNSNMRTVELEWVTSDISSLTASKLTINVVQQFGIVFMTLVTQSSNNGIDRRIDYQNSLDYVVYYIPNYYPFGNGIAQYAYKPNIVAMSQAFSQHLGHTIANIIYGWGEDNFVLQGKPWVSSGNVGGSAQYLEGFNPNIGEPYEMFKWIPVGLLNDLIDTNTDPAPVVDNVSGFTYANIEAAYYGEPGTMADFKNALKAIKPLQAGAIDQLFASYAY